MAAKTSFLIIFFLLVSCFSVAAIRTFHVQETDLVQLKTQANDPDYDKISYYFSPPLNDKGEWQTGYDDAGEYELEIKASDGVNETKEKILLIVDNKNRPPIQKIQNITVNEKEVVDLKPAVADPDGDTLSYTFNPPFNSQGLWKTGYDDEGIHLAEFTANDGGKDGPASQKFKVKIIVLHSNQPPSIIDSFSEEEIVKIKEDQILEFWVRAEDKDENNIDYNSINYTWQLNNEIVSTKDSSSSYFDFGSAGQHSLRVEVNDGEFTVFKEWNLMVENTNRAPKFKLIPITVKEGEKITLDLPTADLDGDKLTYNFQTPIEKGEWQTGYEEAGEYNLQVTVSDGELTDMEKVKITVLDVDRAPELTVPNAKVKENEPVAIKIESSDPDKDPIHISFQNLPEGATFNENKKELSWTPSYDAVARQGGFISNFLNNLRLEQFLMRSKNYPILVTSCGKELCTSKEANIVVYNVNRQPKFTSLNSVTVTETETLKLDPIAVDPDGDKVHYYFTWPLGKRTGAWQTGFEDADTYTVYVTATDGFAGTTMPITVKVAGKNREPKIVLSKNELMVNEGQEFSLPVSATDPDNDKNLTLTLESLPKGASFNEGIFTWTPDYDIVANKNDRLLNRMASRIPFLNKKLNDEKNVVWLKFIASDGQYQAVSPVKVTVKNVNRAPTVIDYLPESQTAAFVGQAVIFHVVGKDEDKDTLSYKWEFGPGEAGVVGTDTIERTFITTGDKKIKVTVSDGRSETEKVWNVQVVNPPVEEEPEMPQLPFTISVAVIES